MLVIVRWQLQRDFLEGQVRDLDIKMDAALDDIEEKLGVGMVCHSLPATTRLRADCPCMPDPLCYTRA